MAKAPKTPVVKTRKRRKPMSKEQRAAAAERLAKARAAKGESKNLSLHKDIRESKRRPCYFTSKGEEVVED